MIRITMCRAAIEKSMNTTGLAGGRQGKWLITVVCLVAAVVFSPALHAAESPLLMGIFPRNRPAETIAMYAPLANYLSEQLGRKVNLVTSKDFDTFWKEVMERRYDIVHYNQYHYINSARFYRVIASNQEFGKSAVAGTIYVRKDSGITSLSQLRGRAIMFGGGKDAMLSYIGPRFLLKQAGLNEEDFSTKFALNPPNALLALYHRQADAAGGGDILIDLPAVKTAINTNELMALAKTEPLLFLPWAVKRTVPPQLAESIQSLMLNLGQNDAGRQVLVAAKTTGLGKADDRDYDPHRKMAAAVFGAQGAGK